MYSQKINLTSWKIQETIIQICTNQVKEIMINEIVHTGMFAIMCDEARYINVFNTFFVTNKYKCT